MERNKKLVGQEWGGFETGQSLGYYRGWNRRKGSVIFPDGAADSEGKREAERRGGETFFASFFNPAPSERPPSRPPFRSLRRQASSRTLTTTMQRFAPSALSPTKIEEACAAPPQRRPVGDICVPGDLGVNKGVRFRPRIAGVRTKHARPQARSLELVHPDPPYRGKSSIGLSVLTQARAQPACAQPSSTQVPSRAGRSAATPRPLFLLTSVTRRECPARRERETAVKWQLSAPQPHQEGRATDLSIKRLKGTGVHGTSV